MQMVSLWTVSREMWREALQPHVSGVSTDILLFSERGAPLIHHYRVFGGGSAHNSLRRNYIIRLRAFVAEAAAHWVRRRDSACPAVTMTSAYPREFRQRDADVDLTRRKSRRAVSPRKPIVPAVPVSSLVLRYHYRRKIVLPVSSHPNLLHTCSPLRGVQCLLRLLGLLLVAMFVVLARYR